MTELLEAAWHLFGRALRSTLRLPVFLVLSIVQLIVWLLLFTPLMATGAAVPGFGASSYLEFVAPGIVVMTALFSSVWSGVGLLQDMERGVLDRFLGRLRGARRRPRHPLLPTLPADFVADGRPDRRRSVMPR